MTPTFDAVARSWPFEPWLLAGLLLAIAVYLRGWLALHRRDERRWRFGQPAAFGAGLAVLFLALASPIEPFTSLLLQVHMLQHVMLMMVAPPLLWLGAPAFPLLLGLPRPIRKNWVAPFVRCPWLRRGFQNATHPLPAWVLFTAATWLWHLPPVYDFALSWYGWHYLEHICFLGAALLFWYPVIRPYPSQPSWSPWLLVPYLILADVQNTLLSAVLTFADQPLYSSYVNGPRLGNLSPLDDQAAAGVLMWVPGSVVYLIPLFVIGIRLLFGAAQSSSLAKSNRVGWALPTGVSPRWAEPTLRRAVAIPGPRLETRPLDVLRIPLVGRFLRWRHARLSLQVPLLLAALVVVWDGLRGPQIGPMNLAGVLPWIHWRGLLILGLLVAGNVFCTACPFTLPRTLARRWLPQGRTWPRVLRNKWLAVILVAGFLWAYEAFALWDNPWLTAWIVIAYFTAAFLVDGLFQGGSFCKYVCPIGQFNFVQSLVSPLEVRVRSANVCASCRTNDCIRGRDEIPGCELELFQPKKSSNMDCTFCLDCVHACPHDNVGILPTMPGRALWHDSFRSGIGRLSKRPDLAALVVVLTFGGFINAAGMVSPIVEWRDQLASLLRLHSPRLLTTMLYVIGLIILPLILIPISAAVSRSASEREASVWELGTRFTYALVPIGFGMWLAHYSFHFLASFDAFVPPFERLAHDHGWTSLFANSDWVRACCRPVADWLPRLQILFLDVGFLSSLYAAYRIALAQSERISQALKMLMPWAILLLFLFAAGVWIVLQPMEMRGTLAAMG